MLTYCCEVRLTVKNMENREDFDQLLSRVKFIGEIEQFLKSLC